MSQSAVSPEIPATSQPLDPGTSAPDVESQSRGQDASGKNSTASLHGLIAVSPPGLNKLTSDLCSILEEAGCPLAPPVQERLRFETLLADLSATFVNLPAAEVDAQIESSLRCLVEFLEIDRSGLAELLIDQEQLVVTHSYHAPGAPQMPRIILTEQLPWYARTIQQGEILNLSRLPDDLPHAATREREYCGRVGLKSHLTIPLKVMDSVVGTIAFGSFRSYRDWPDDLVQRLRLVGEIFT